MSVIQTQYNLAEDHWNQCGRGQTQVTSSLTGTSVAWNTFQTAKWEVLINCIGDLCSLAINSCSNGCAKLTVARQKNIPVETAQSVMTQHFSLCFVWLGSFPACSSVVSYFMGVTTAVDTQCWVSLCAVLFPNTPREQRQQLQHRFGFVRSMNGDVPQVDEEMRGERWCLYPGQARQCVWNGEGGAAQCVDIQCAHLDGVSVCLRQTDRLVNLIITFSEMRLDCRQRHFVVKPIGLNLSLHMCICFNPQGTQDNAFTCCHKPNLSTSQ